MDICLSLFIITVGSPHSPEAMPFIKPLCPSVAFERPEVKGLRAFGFRSFYKCGTKSLIGPIGVDIQLFNPIPVQNQPTMFVIVAIVQALSGLGLIFLVLLHSGKGGGLSDMFGGGIGAQTAGSTVVEQNLDRITVLTALVFAFTTITLGLLF